jgi:hypothetical protein
VQQRPKNTIHFCPLLPLIDARSLGQKKKKRQPTVIILLISARLAEEYKLLAVFGQKVRMHYPNLFGINQF